MASTGKAHRRSHHDIFVKPSLRSFILQKSPFQPRLTSLALLQLTLLHTTRLCVAQTWKGTTHGGASLQVQDCPCMLPLATAILPPKVLTSRPTASCAKGCAQDTPQTAGSPSSLNPWRLGQRPRQDWPAKVSCAAKRPPGPVRLLPAPPRPATSEEQASAAMAWRPH